MAPAPPAEPLLAAASGSGADSVVSGSCALVASSAGAASSAWAASSGGAGSGSAVSSGGAVSRARAVSSAGASAAGASVAGAPPPSASLGSPITASTAPTSTVSSSCALISSSTPEVGEGISVSTLSVDTSRSGSSASTVSPTCLSHRLTVPSVTLSPSAGRVTEVDMAAEDSFYRASARLVLVSLVVARWTRSGISCAGGPQPSDRTSPRSHCGCWSCQVDFRRLRAASSASVSRVRAAACRPRPGGLRQAPHPASGVHG